MDPETTQCGERGLEACGDSDPESLAALREKYHTSLVRILRARGASATETEDILEDLWADCVPGSNERKPLLARFSGRCALQAWLATVATNRWLDLKRKQARRGEMQTEDVATCESRGLESLSDPRTALARDETLIELLRQCLEQAFALVPSEAMVSLRLVYLHGLTQREVMRMLGWSESKMSRTLTGAMETIANETVRELQRRDPLLQLTWQDFVDLCETHRVGFL